MNQDYVDLLRRFKNIVQELAEIEGVCEHALCSGPLEEEESMDAPYGEAPQEKPWSLEEVRAVLARKARAGFRENVRTLLQKHGAEHLSELDPSRYGDVVREAEGFGNAR